MGKRGKRVPVAMSHLLPVHLHKSSAITVARGTEQTAEISNAADSRYMVNCDQPCDSGFSSQPTLYHAPQITILEHLRSLFLRDHSVLEH